MNQKIKFLHVADLHLDTPFNHIGAVNAKLKDKLNQATFDSFEKLIDIAMIEQVDFVLIVGDCFNQEQPSVYTQLFLKKQLEKLTDNGIKVFVNYGNHDFLSGNRLVQFSEKVSEFKTPTVETKCLTINGLKVNISAFSYTQRQHYSRQINEFPVKDVRADFHIGMLHGQVDSQDNPYAPFTIQEINAKGYDYFALGHVHKREILQQNPPIVYPGNIQGLNRKELGEKGGYLVTLEKNQKPIINFVATSSIIFSELKVNVTSEDNLLNVIATIQDNFKTEAIHLFTIYFEVDTNVQQDLLSVLESGELLDTVFNEYNYIIKSIIKIRSQKEKVFLQDDLQQMYQEILSDNMDMVRDVVAELATHYKIKQVLPHLINDEQFLEEILYKAKQLVIEKIEGI